MSRRWRTNAVLGRKGRRILTRIARKPWLGPSLGAATGLFGGPVFAILGLLLGYLLQQVAKQLQFDRAVLRYYENPQSGTFYETEPGMAAYCALGIIFYSSSAEAAKNDRALIATVAHSALKALFPAQTPDGPDTRDSQQDLESFCAIALRQRAQLNPYLLAEHLSALRLPYGDAPRIGKALGTLALGSKTLEEAEQVRSILEPLYQAGAEWQGGEGQYRLSEDPYRVLGINPGASAAEVKTIFRKLAISVHPDTIANKDADRQQKASGDFIAISNAYKEIMSKQA